MAGIEFTNVSFSYPNGYTANEELTFRIQPGERVAIIGQNGAGKTTVAKMMNGLNKPTTGIVTVDDINTKYATTAQIAKKVGYVFQNPDEQIFNSTVISEIEYMPRYFKLADDVVKKRIDQVLKLTELEALKDVNPMDISYSIRKFITIAAVLATEPKYTIWDEPTAGQDPKRINTLKNIMDYLEKAGVAVVVITHDMDFVVNMFKRVIVMANKKIIADGTPREIFSRDEILAESCVDRPQIGSLAHKLNIKDSLLFRDEIVQYLTKEGCIFNEE